MASAQTSPTTQYPGTTVAPPTTAPATTTTTFVDDGNTAVGSSGALGPGATVNLTVTDDELNSDAVNDPGTSTNAVDGQGSSTPYSLGRATASNDTVTFSNVKLPADFSRNANHSVTVKDAATGQVLATKTFGVSASGAITAPISTSGLPKTGSDFVDPALKVGGALLALGGAAVLVARRRKVEAGTPV